MPLLRLRPNQISYVAVTRSDDVGPEKTWVVLAYEYGGLSNKHVDLMELNTNKITNMLSWCYNFHVRLKQQTWRFFTDRFMVKSNAGPPGCRNAVYPRINQE